MRRLFVGLSLLLLLGIVTQTQTAANGAKVSCKDEDGEDVDWFYMYKLPKHYTHNSISGLHYLYITSRKYDEWIFGKSKVSEHDSMPARTLNPLFADQTVLLIAYNDEFPNGTYIDTGGHAKGVVATDGETGIWLIHSVPKYPSIPNYEYPSSGEQYGQSFLCLSLKESEMEKVGKQLLFNEPNIYYKRVPVMLNDKFPNLERAIAREWHKEAPYHNMEQLETVAGKKFKSFAKGHKFAGDLYEDLLAPELDVNLLVETWRNGKGNMPSNCTLNDKVYNVAEIASQEMGIAFKTTSDHSKWAVSQVSGFRLWRWRVGGSDWICVGDINRQQHQRVRGGGSVCLKSGTVANLYRGMIAKYENCGSEEDATYA